MGRLKNHRSAELSLLSISEDLLIRLWAGPVVIMKKSEELIGT